MFEVFGFMIIRCAGFGWLWGHDDYQKMQTHDVFGDGSNLLLIGFIGMFVVMGGGMLLIKLILGE